MNNIEKEYNNTNYLRREILEFAFAMEEEMRKKDKLGYENKSRKIEYLEEKLHEERDEVDECFINDDMNKFISEESLHEGIMLALLRYRIKEEQSKPKLE